MSKVNIEGSNILADKAYGSLKIREYITFQKASYTIPPKWNVNLKNQIESLTSKLQ